MDNITFEQLPQAVSMLIEKVGQLADKVEKVLGNTGQRQERRLLTVDDVATLLNKSSSTIYAMTSDKRIPYHKRGNKLYSSRMKSSLGLSRAEHRERATRKSLTNGLRHCVAARGANRIHLKQAACS